jgi:hypothetical protein
MKEKSLNNDCNKDLFYSPSATTVLVFALSLQDMESIYISNIPSSSTLISKETSKIYLA